MKRLLVFAMMGLAVFLSMWAFTSCGLRPIPVTDHSQKRSDAAEVVARCNELHRQGLDTWNPDRFKEIIASLEGQPKGGDFSYLFHYYVALANYRLFVYHGITGGQPKSSYPYLEAASEAIETSIRLNSQFAEAHALYSMILGMRMGVKPYLGVFYGSRSRSHIARAIELGPDNPRVHMIRGIMKLNTPAMFGGNTEVAIGEFQGAVALFESERPGGLGPAWGKDENYVWLGLGYRKKGDESQAEKWLLKAISTNENNYWARQELIKGGKK